jgi:hypothetical protein
MAARYPPETIKALRLALLASIGAQTAIGAALGGVVEPALSGDERYAVAGALFLTGVAGYVFARYLTRRELRDGQSGDWQRAVITESAFAEAPATLGLVTALIAGQGLLAVPFGAFALLAWALSAPRTAAEADKFGPEGFPRL